MKKGEILTKLDEEFRVFENYLIGNKGTIYNHKRNKVDTFPILDIRARRYRRANLICMVWIGKTKTNQNVGYFDGDKTNLKLENLYYIEPKRKKKENI